MGKNTRLSLTPIRLKDFEPPLESEKPGWHNPLEQVRQDLKHVRPERREEEGACGYRHAPAGDPDEEGYDHIGQRTFNFESPDVRFHDLNHRKLFGD